MVEGFTPNPSHTPAAAMGKRVIVILRNGMRCGDDPVSPTAPRGWPADGKGACHWHTKSHPFSIAHYRII